MPWKWPTKNLGKEQGANAVFYLKIRIKVFSLIEILY